MELWELWELGSPGPHDLERHLEWFLRRHARWEPYLSLEQFRCGDRAATEQFMFEEFRTGRPWVFECGRRSDALNVRCELNEAEARDIATVFRCIGSREDRDDFCAIFGGEALETVYAPNVLPPWRTPKHPGVYRRQHASVLLFSGTTALLVDPVGLVRDAWISDGGRVPAPDRFADGVLVTHSHDDHWHLPSILVAAASEATPVVVPCVPVPSVLCQHDMAHELTAVGQRVLEPAWWESCKIGDFSIDVLPFYGEQPTRTRPLGLGLARNWGNCYRVSCDAFSVLVLADSGDDPQGSVHKVVADSCSMRGPVDAVLTCCETFPEVLNVGLPYYVTVVRSVELGPILERGCRSITQGPEGAATTCAIAGAQHLLPYAHGFAGVGRPVSSETEPSGALARTAAALAKTRASTTILHWNPGDAVVFDSPHQPRLLPAFV